MKTRRGPAGRGPSRKSRSFSRPILERMEDRLLLTVFTVSNTTDSGAGSLRQAILDSNASATALPNVINFNLPAGLETISVGNTTKTALPAITQQVTIDGTTASGYDPTKPVPTIEINGNDPNLPSGTPAFAINSTNVALKALIIDAFKGLDAGVVINGGSDSVQGCWIGLDPTGKKLRGNGGEGITVSSSNNTIGGTTLAARNVISGNFDGIHVTGAGATGNLIEGNFIGTDSSGLVALGNTFDGIDIDTAANTIGGTSSVANGILSGAGNVITAGFSAIKISGTGANNNVVQGNFLGTDATGLSLAANAAGTGTKRTFLDGIDVDSASNTLIGGSTAGLKNVISGNGGYGIQVSSSTEFNTQIQGNDIGVGVDGSTALGNQSSGVYVNGASNVIIGGTILGGSAPQLGNIIAYNGSSGLQTDGVTIQGGQHDAVLTNQIFSNGGLGIRLASGGNQGVQPPTLQLVQSGPGQTRITGSYFGLPNTFYRIQFFSNPTPDPSGAGEGKNFIGELTIGTNSLGNANFGTILPQGVPIGNYVSATATQQVLVINNTSQFSTDVQATLAQVTDLSVNTAAAATALLNQNFTFTVTVTNNGPQDATGVVLTDTIPTNSTFVSTSAGQFLNGVVTDNIGNLASGASVTVSIVVKPTSLTGSFTNTAVVTGNELDTSPSNNTKVTTVPVVSDADLSVNLTANPNPAAIGSPITYTLIVGNNGPGTTNNTVATVTLPAGLTNIVVSPDQGTSTTNGNTVTINLGILPANTSSTTTIVGTPTVTGTLVTTATVMSELVDPNSMNNSMTLPVQVANAADLAIQMDAAPNPVLIGQELLYTIQVTNNGPSQATSPVVTDKLPAGVTYVPADSNAGGNGTLAFANGVVTATLNALPAGGVYTVTIAVIPTASGQLSNVASVADPNATNPAELDPDPTNNTTLPVITQVSPADIAVSVENPADPLVIGTPAVFQLLITNDGPADATNVILTDQFSSNGTILSSSVGTPVGGTLSVNLGTIASGQSLTVTITVNPTAAGNLIDTATVRSDEFDSNPNNNTSSSSNLVSPVDLVVGVTGSPNPVLVGGQVVYVVTVTNSGPTTANNVLFTDTLPASATLNSATSSQGSVAGASGNTVAGNLGSLAPGASATVTISVTANAISTATDSASVTSDGFETNPANNTGSASVSVINLPGTIEIGSRVVFVGENAGFASVIVDRVGGTLGTVTASYATADFDAIAGVNYVASSGVVTFLDGQTTATIKIPVLDDGKVNGSHAFSVFLSNPTGGAALGANNVASVVVTNTDRDTISPSIIGLTGIPGNKALNGFVVTFNKAMDLSRVSLVSNYHVFLSNPDGGAGQVPVTLAAVEYNPATNSVNLIPTTPLPLNRFYRIVVNATYGLALTDVSGNVLAGDFGPGTNYDLYYGQGTSLRYIDSQANSVTITLTGAGSMSLFRGLSGDAASVELHGIVPHMSKISGTVKKLNKHASGHTAINFISGLGQFGDVKSNLTTPPFYVISAPVGVASLTGPKTVTAAAVTSTPIPLVLTGKKAPKGPALTR